MDREQQNGQWERSRWPPTREQVLWTVGIVALLSGAILIGYRYDITLWDWIKLLIVPAVIAGGGLWFNRQQRERELETAREQRERDVEIAERRTQDEALQAYLDQMGQMLLDKDEPLVREARGGEDLLTLARKNVSTLARARTLTVLTRLDGKRKGTVVRFLYEAGLIGWWRRLQTFEGEKLIERPIAKDGGVVDLRDANLGGADLAGAVLNGANLSNADLREAYVKGTQLREANLSKADLVGAILRGTNLIGANLIGANLGNADLSTALLREADLSKANFTGANLRNAKLSGANLRGANLRGAKGITNEKLDKPSVSLEGATMPDGQKYEEWLKDKEGRKENE